MLVRWAFRDDLTGLLNRRGFRLLAARRIRAAGRAGRTVVLFFVDLDGFKSINDAFGHAEGDRALARTAASLKRTFRRTDVLARMGGDEFVALVTENPRCSPAALCRRLQRNLARASVEESRYGLSLSIGVASVEPETKPSLRRLLDAADLRLQHLKHARHAACDVGAHAAAR